jgi:hypothetical protein
MYYMELWLGSQKINTKCGKASNCKTYHCSLFKTNSLSLPKIIVCDEESQPS